MSFSPATPARSDIAAAYLDDAKLMSNNREHRTFTGYYKGVSGQRYFDWYGLPFRSHRGRRAITSAQRLHPNRRCSALALDPNIRIGDLMTSRAAMKNEGTSRFYVPDSFLKARFELTWHLIETREAANHGRGRSLCRHQLQR